jgi:hypothetical protein
LSIHGRIDSEDDDGGEDGEHIHDAFDVGPQEQLFEAEFYLFSPDFFYLVKD